MGIQQLLFVKSISDFVMTISANQLKLNLATWASANGWNGTSAAVITIASGVFVYSDSTATAALTTGSFPGGLTLINDGSIIGKGGNGGGSYGGFSYTAAQAGGPAMSLGCNCSINNTNGLIGGGGGGGGGGVGAVVIAGGGGGAGGGTGGGEYSSYSSTYWAGGAGGAVGASGSNGTASQKTGGGGGRVKAATTTAGPVTNLGSSTHTAGYGGSGGGTGFSFDTTADGLGSTGGSGGGVVAGGNGAVTGASQEGSGGGGGWGGAGGTMVGNSTFITTRYAGGAAGKSVDRNGYTPTWIAVGARYGTDS